MLGCGCHFGAISVFQDLKNCRFFDIIPALSYPESDEFDAYISQGEPLQRAKGYAWKTAIGLQAVDGLQTSDYLLQTAKSHIEGDITIDEAQTRIRSYYESREQRLAAAPGTEEADKVAANIAQILNEDTLSFSVSGLLAVHRRLFRGVFNHAGKLRTVNLTKKEWVLRGDSVRYVSYVDLEPTISYDLSQEKKFVYAGLSQAQIVTHLVQFVSNLWQIHPFREGNTRTTAVFTILYLRSLGFEVENDLFAAHSWYFRNALVRANYQNVAKGIERDTTFLEKFFRNLLMGEANELKNRYMLVSSPLMAGEEDELMRDEVQVPHKYRISTAQVAPLLQALAESPLGVKELMEQMGLRHRVHFLTHYITPALQDGVIEQLYPESPRHPRQKYRLTDKGRAML